MCSWEGAPRCDLVAINVDRCNGTQHVGCKECFEEACSLRVSIKVIAVPDCQTKLDDVWEVCQHHEEDVNAFCFGDWYRKSLNGGKPARK